MMCSAFVWSMSVQCQGHCLRFNIVWLYFESALYLLTPGGIYNQLCMNVSYNETVQCLCLIKVGSRSRSQSKIKYCMTVFHVRSISFEPLVGFTNNFAQMSSMMRWCAVTMFDQGQGKKLTLFPMLHTGYSSPSVIALVYDLTFLYKKVWFHPVTYGGRHDCFRFRKHPSSCYDGVDDHLRYKFLSYTNIQHIYNIL